MHEENLGNRMPVDAGGADSEDAALEALFAGFDQVQAPDSLKERTLEAIFAQMEGGEAANDGTVTEHAVTRVALPASDAAANNGGLSPDVGGAGGVQAAAAASDETAAANDGGLSPAVVPAKVGKPRHVRHVRGARGTLRMMKALALAACLTLALAGGAYALPVSHATVSQEGITITLDMNVFGYTVGVHSEGEAAEDAQVVEPADVLNKPYRESLERTFESLEQLNPQAPVDVQVESPDGAQRERMEEDTMRVQADHPAPDAPQAMGQPEGGEGQEPPVSPSGQPQQAPDGGDPAVQQAPVQQQDGQAGEQPGEEPPADAEPAGEGGSGAPDGGGGIPAAPEGAIPAAPAAGGDAPAQPGQPG